MAIPKHIKEIIKDQGLGNRSKSTEKYITEAMHNIKLGIIER